MRGLRVDEIENRRGFEDVYTLVNGVNQVGSE